MTFQQPERDKLLQLKWVGETVVSRLEQLGFSRLDQLADVDPAFITKQISDMIGSTCWHNSPQARAAIRSVVGLAINTQLKRPE
jgi:hypothetical protein